MGLLPYMTRTLQLEAASYLALKARGAAGAVATTATAEDVVVSSSGVAIFFKKNDMGRRYYSDIDRSEENRRYTPQVKFLSLLTPRETPHSRFRTRARLELGLRSDRSPPSARACAVIQNRGWRGGQPRTPLG